MISWRRVDELQSEIGEEDFAEVAEMFMSVVEAVIARLRTAPDIGRLEADLHFLKGSALNLGFKTLSDLCRAGEERAAAGQAASVALQPVFDAYAKSRTAFLRGPD